ncbi:MAG: HAMP domain-containing sensor histidine kinase [Campylobacterota bacterium]|nr:HAMP domain-containing sensor histidine kinase [Campylobacterota bacterium]
MLKSEKKSLIRFLLIYLGSTFLLFSLASWIFYTSQKHYIFDQQRDTLHVQAGKLQQELRVLHKSFGVKLVYPTHPSIESAIYDKNRVYIFGSAKETVLLTPQAYREDEERLYYFTKVEPYYLGAAFMLVYKDLDRQPILNLQKSILWFLLGAGLFFTLLGLFLGKLFVAPMRESMERMNNFIQDTTHELNTPISTILTNIEMLETFGKCEKNDELQRIEIASKTLSRIYDDLTYLNLNHNYHRRIENINVSVFLKERMLYFKMMAENKGLDIEVNIKDNVILNIDKNDITRLVDNLISNAIKYNKPNGLLAVQLSNDSLVVSDTGVGIEKKDLANISQRFKRANTSEGGFGIGLDIVNQVVNSYGFSLNIKSEWNKGTEVSVQWEK